LQELVAGFVELDAQVGHLVGVEQVAAEDVGFVVGGGQQAAGQFDGLGYGEAVAVGEAAGKGVAHGSHHADAGHVAVARQIEDVHLVFALQGEVGGTVVAGEGDGDDFDGGVGAGAFNQ